jgi:hypothetical protein
MLDSTVTNVIVQSNDVVVAWAAALGAVGGSLLTGIVAYLVTRRQVRKTTAATRARRPLGELQPLIDFGTFTPSLRWQRPPFVP